MVNRTASTTTTNYETKAISRRSSGGTGTASRRTATRRSTRSSMCPRPAVVLREPRYLVGHHFLALLWFAIVLLKPERPGRVFLWSLTFYPVFATISFGQNTFISVAIFAGVYRLLSNERPFAAGLAAGLLWFKPQLLLGLFIWWAFQPRRYALCWPRRGRDRFRSGGGVVARGAGRLAGICGDTPRERWVRGVRHVECREPEGVLSPTAAGLAKGGVLAARGGVFVRRGVA